MKYQASIETTQIFRELLTAHSILWDGRSKTTTRVKSVKLVKQADKLFSKAIREAQSVR